MDKQQFMQGLRDSRDLMHCFCENNPELIARLPDGVRSDEEAAAWAEFYLTVTVGPEEEGDWETVVDTDHTLYDLVYYTVYFYLGPGLSNLQQTTTREQVMWCLWGIGSPDPFVQEPSLDLRAAPWQAASWIEEVLPHGGVLHLRSADEDITALETEGDSR